MIQYVAQRPGRGSALAVRLTERVAAWSQSGIGAIELPPTRQTQYGPYSASLGYDPVRDYDWGNCGMPTRVGYEVEIQTLSRSAHAHGMRLTGDFVDRQYGGRPPYVELTAAGRPNPNLFYKGAGLFQGVLRDTQFDPELVPDDGTVACYEHSLPAGWMLREKCKADAAMMGALGLDGGRQDEAKSMGAAALHALFAARPGGWNVAEYYTGDQAKLDRFWVTFRVPVIDFPYHYACRDVANGAACTRLVGSAYADANPNGAYRYVESLDTDGANGVRWNKLWFYLHGMTTPCKAFRVYAGDFEAYGLGRWILNYAWIHAKLAFGALRYVVQEDDLLAWTRNGDGGDLGQSAGVLCGFSRDPLRWQSRWVDTPWRNCWIKNYAASARGEQAWVYADGRALIAFGPNVDGSAQNGVAYSVLGQDGPVVLAALPDVVKEWVR